MLKPQSIDQEKYDFIKFMLTPTNTSFNSTFVKNKQQNGKKFLETFCIEDKIDKKLESSFNKLKTIISEDGFDDNVFSGFLRNFLVELSGFFELSGENEKKFVKNMQFIFPDKKSFLLCYESVFISSDELNQEVYELVEGVNGNFYKKVK